jgi:hypothetical protein
MHFVSTTVDRGLSIVLTLMTGVALFAAEACSSELRARRGRTATTLVDLRRGDRSVEVPPPIDVRRGSIAASARTPERRPHAYVAQVTAE